MTPARLPILAAMALMGLGLLPQAASAQQAAADGPDRGRIEAIVRDYLLANPEILREMAAKLQVKDREAASAQRQGAFAEYRDTIYDSKNQVVLGNPKGDVTLVEFFDYNCGYCRRAFQDTQTLLKSDPKLRIVLKEMPVLSEESRDAARVAVAVHAQAPEKYFDFHREMLTSDAPADGPRAIEVARKLGLDVQRLSADLADPNVDATLLEVHQLAEKLGIDGTPSYVIGDTVVPGAVGADALKGMVGSVRACGKTACS